MGTSSRFGHAQVSLLHAPKDWADSPIPENYVTKPEFKAVMDSLVKESQALAEMIAKNAADNDIKAALTALHDRFHQAEAMCIRK